MALFQLVEMLHGPQLEFFARRSFHRERVMEGPHKRAVITKPSPIARSTFRKNTIIRGRSKGVLRGQLPASGGELARFLRPHKAYMRCTLKCFLSVSGGNLRLVDRQFSDGSVICPHAGFYPGLSGSDLSALQVAPL